MSEIVFSSTLDNSKLDAAIKESNKTISDWAKGVEKAGDNIDKILDGSSKSFKEAIKFQKELIKSIEENIKQLQKEREEVAPGKAEQAVILQLREARRTLAEAKGTLSKLQEDQIAATEKEKESQGGIIESLKKWAVGLFTLHTALKITKDIIASTEGTTHAFEKVVSEATAGVQYFFRAIASGDWSNFRKGFTDAMKAAGEFTDKMEDIANRTNEQKIKSAQISEQIAELRADTWDKGEENTDKLINAEKQIIELQKKDYAQQAKIAEDTYKTNLENAATQRGIDKDHLDNLISEYTANKEIIDLGEKYNLKQAQLNAARSVPNNIKRVNEIKQEVAALGEGAEAAGKLAEKFEQVPMKLRTSLADLKATQIQLEGQAKIGSRRDENLLAAAENRKKKEAEDAKKRAEDEKKLTSQLEVQRELLDKAIEKGNQDDIKAIAKKIFLLENELSLRKQIAEKAIAANIERVKISKITGISIPSVSTYEVPNELATAPTGKEASKYIGNTVMMTEAAWKKQKKDKEDAEKKEKESLEQQIKLRREIAAAASELIPVLQQILGLSDDEANALDSWLSSLSSGNYIAFLTTYFSYIVKIFDKSQERTERYKASLEEINKLLERNSELLNQASKIGGSAKIYEDRIKLLSQELEIQQKEAERIIRLAEEKHKEALPASIKQKIIDDYTFEIRTQLEEIEAEYEQWLSGGITQSTLADSIVSAFDEGKTAIDDFADYLNNTLYDAVKEIFKQQLLNEITSSGIMDYITSALSDKKLTEDERQKIQEMFATVGESQQQLWNDLTAVIPVTAKETSGLTGEIQRNITEDTGTELAGLMRKISDDNRMNRDYNKAGVDHLINIEANTFGSWAELQKANGKLDTIISNTKPAYTGITGG